MTKAKSSQARLLISHNELSDGFIATSITTIFPRVG